MSRERNAQRTAMKEREDVAVIRARARSLPRAATPPTTNDATTTLSNSEGTQAPEPPRVQEPPHASSPGPAPSTIVGASADRSANADRSWAVLSETDAQIDGAGAGVEEESPARSAGGAENADNAHVDDKTLSDLSGSWMTKDASFRECERDREAPAKEAGPPRLTDREDPKGEDSSPPKSREEMYLDTDDPSEKHSNADSDAQHRRSRNEVKHQREKVAAL